MHNCLASTDAVLAAMRYSTDGGEIESPVQAGYAT
jgi:hypothetical protein